MDAPHFQTAPEHLDPTAKRSAELAGMGPDTGALTTIDHHMAKAYCTTAEAIQAARAGWAICAGDMPADVCRAVRP
jgi:hypothetical protein